jgi:methylmalonyl-CoA/ethylmalonyl-CoA epimerase
MSQKIRIDHIGIAVPSLEKGLPFWAQALGLEVGGIETVPSENVKVAFLETGNARIELLESTDDSSAVAKFLSKRSPGIHHLTFQVDAIDAMLKRLTQHGVRVLGDGVRQGAGGTRVAFLHPASTGGVLVELVQRAGTQSAEAADAPPVARDTTDIGPGSPVLAYLRDPQEKLWGVLSRMDAAGVVMEGIDLGSFDDWIAQIERDEESVVGPSLLFVPMSRVEKLLLDRSSGHLPSLAERFERRTGRTVQDVIKDV